MSWSLLQLVIACLRIRVTLPTTRHGPVCAHSSRMPVSSLATGTRDGSLQVKHSLCKAFQSTRFCRTVFPWHLFHLMSMMASADPIGPAAQLRLVKIGMSGNAMHTQCIAAVMLYVLTHGGMSLKQLQFHRVHKSLCPSVFLRLTCQPA